MTADDLNSRVQARLAIFEGIAAGENWLIFQDQLEDTTQAWALFLRSRAGMHMPASWRERWERHRPILGVTVCGTCAHPMDRPDGMPGGRTEWDGDLCDDALAVLREIGVEP